jgi:hypothetical protein
MDNNRDDIRQRVTIDDSDVYRSISEIEAAAQRSAHSVSALSSNIIAQIAAVSQAGYQQQQMPGMMNAAMMAQMSPQMSGQHAMAQDAMMMGYQAMGPAQGGFGPAMTTPYGDPTVDMFRQSGGASPYAINPGFAAGYAPPGAPGDPRKGNTFFSMGEGSLFDIGRMAASSALFGRIGNDNLEDRMYRNVNRRSEYFSTNMRTVQDYMAGDVAFGAAGAMIGGAMGAPFGGVGGLAGSVAGGMLGSAVGNYATTAIQDMAKPYADMASDLRQYTAPFIRGNRLGGGMSQREQFQSQRELGRKVASDNFFTASEYGDMQGLAGESGVFQFTGSKDKAMAALDKMGESVKTMYALGVKSREMLKTIDQALGSFGINPAGDPKSLASFLQTMSGSAMSANMSLPQMLSATAPAAQMFASQGIGMAAGARIAGMNLGAGGDLFRSGKLGGFDNAYFGGAEGFGNAVTQGTASLYRTPIGEAMLSSMFAPGGQNLRRVMDGQTLSVDQIVMGAGQHASHALRYVGMQALMPQLTQNMGGEMQTGIMQTYIKTYREQMGVKGAINPEDFLGYLVSTGIPKDQALAMYKFMGSAGSVASGIRRSASDQVQMNQIEGMRSPTIFRKMEKGYERSFGKFANDISSGLNEWNAGAGEAIEEWSTGIHHYDIGETGRAVRQSPNTARASYMAGIHSLDQFGFKPSPVTSRNGAEITEGARLKATERLLDDSELARYDRDKLINTVVGEGKLYRSQIDNALDRNRHINAFSPGVDPADRRALQARRDVIVRQRHDAFQAENMDMVSGMGAFSRGDNQSLIDDARGNVSSAMLTVGADRLGAAIATNADGTFNRDATRDNLAPLFFGGRTYAKLSDREKGQLGANIGALGEARLGGRENLARMFAGSAARMTADVSQLSLEQLKKQRDTNLGSVGGDIKKALSSDGLDRGRNANLVGGMALEEMMRRAGSVGDLDAMIKDAGVTGEQLESLGFDRASYVADRAKYTDAYGDRMTRAMDGLGDDDRKKLGAARNQLRDRGGWFSSGTDAKGALRGALGEVQNAQDTIFAAPGAIEKRSMDEIRHRARSSTIGGQDIGGLVDVFNAERGRSDKGIEAVLGALSGDAQASNNLGISKDYLDTMRSALGENRGGKGISLDKVRAIIKAGSPELSDDDIKPMLKTYADHLAKNPGAGTEFLETSMRSALTRGQVAPGAVGGDTAGGILAPETVKSLALGIEALNKNADALEKISANFAPMSADKFAQQVDDLKNQKDKFSDGVKLFGEFVDKLPKDGIRVTVDQASYANQGRPPLKPSNTPGATK